MKIGKHISPDDMERYLLGKVRGPYEVTMIDEHLIWCVECVDRMIAAERIVLARSLAHSVNEDPIRPRS